MKVTVPEHARRLFAVLAVVGAMGGASAASAQQPYGTFDLTVRDQRGAPIPRAMIGIVRDGVTGHVRVDDDGRGRFGYRSRVPIDFCGGYEFAGPSRPLSCVRGVSVEPGETRRVELVVETLPFEAWVAAFAGPDWLRGFTPFWVQNHVPDAPLWSGPDTGAVAFGTRAQWSYFLVAGPAVGGRLYVHDQAHKNYAWIDAAAVGPSGPPPTGPFPAAQPRVGASGAPTCFSAFSRRPAARAPGRPGPSRPRGWPRHGQPTSAPPRPASRRKPRGRAARRRRRHGRPGGGGPWSSRRRGT